MATTAPAGDDPELRAEQDYLDLAHGALSAMHTRARALLEDLRDAGHPDLDYQAALMHRIAVLAESPRPLLFGRIDEEAGPSWHIGRRHVEDQEGDPVVIDWRAPVAVPFYQARADNVLGLSRRRQVMVDRAKVIAVADDLFGRLDGDSSTTRLRGGRSESLSGKAVVRRAAGRNRGFALTASLVRVWFRRAQAAAVSRPICWTSIRSI